MKKTWLRDNITSILTLIIVPIVLLLIKMILTKEIHVEKEVAFLLIGILASTLKDVTQYYYGASKGTVDIARAESENKQQSSTVTQTLETKISEPVKPEETVL